MIPRAVREKIPPRILELISFVAVGGINACFGYGMFCLMISLEFRPVIALLIANILGVVFNFLTYGNLVFRRSGWRRLPFFIAFYIINYFANAYLLVALHGLIPSPYLAQLLILPLSVFFLYFSLRYFVFRSLA